MQSVNNCLNMSINSDANEIALDKLKNILVSFEKKKRNLEKRKNKLDEYKKKADLNEDQQNAVEKYPEVMSNLELLEELTTHAVQQLKEAEKLIKKTKKQEKIDKKRFDLQLIEFVLRHYCVSERIGSNERIRQRLLCENITSEKEIENVTELFKKVHLSDKAEWKLCSEQLQVMYEASSKLADSTASDEKKVPKEDILSSFNKLTEVEWLWIDEMETCLSNSIQVDARSELSVEEPTIQYEPVPIVEETVPEPEPVISVQKQSIENPKLNFVFLHDSTVQQETTSSTTNENGCARFGSDPEARPSSQTSVGNNWQANDVINTGENVEDVFSSATQSQFLHTDGIKNAWTKNARAPLNGRFRGRPNMPASTDVRELQESDSNSWKATRGAFNPNPRFPRPGRGRGRGRGSGRSDQRQASDVLPSQ